MGWKNLGLRGGRQGRLARAARGGRGPTVTAGPGRHGMALRCRGGARGHGNQQAQHHGYRSAPHRRQAAQRSHDPHEYRSRDGSINRKYGSWAPGFP